MKVPSELYKFFIDLVSVLSLNLILCDSFVILFAVIHKLL